MIKRQNQKYIRNQIIILFILFLFLISFITVFAKYVTNTSNDLLTKSREFYFISDKLTKKGKTYTIKNWSGIEDYVIDINVASKKNTLEDVYYDIPYKIEYKASPDIICQLTKSEGVIPQKLHSDTFSLIVTPNRKFKDGEKVKVEILVTSMEGYNQTLKGEFILQISKEQLSYEIKDKKQNPYIELNLKNTKSNYIVAESFEENEKKYKQGEKINLDIYLDLSKENQIKCYSNKIQIKFNPEMLLLDNTNENYSKIYDEKTTLINDKNYINEFNIEMEPLSTISFRFYKTNINEDYTYPNNNNKSVIEVKEITK